MGTIDCDTNAVQVSTVDQLSAEHSPGITDGANLKEPLQRLFISNVHVAMASTHIGINSFSINSFSNSFFNSFDIVGYSWLTTDYPLFKA